MLTWHSIITVILFVTFVLMGIILYWPRQQHKPYEDAARLALKDDDDAVITPRQHDENNHER